MKSTANYVAQADNARQLTGDPAYNLAPPPHKLETLMHIKVDLSHPDMQRRMRARKVWEYLDEGSSTFYARMNSGEPSYDPLFPKPHRTSSTGKGPKRWTLGEIIAWLQICKAANHI